jgi:hypothetical protein
MSSAQYLITQSIKMFKKVDMSTYVLLLVVLIVNLYKLHSTILGKIINILSVLYLILNEHLSLAIIAFLLILLLNNGTIENFEGSKDTPPGENSDSPANNEPEVDLNDTIASFKAKHCINKKLVDKDNKEINIADLSNIFPNIQFNIENEKCNPCEDNCDFKITSNVELITTEESLRAVPSGSIGTQS